MTDLSELEKDSESVLDAPDFISDDGEHDVHWTIDPKLGYPIWECVTHGQPYYLNCVNIRPKSQES